MKGIYVHIPFCIKKCNYCDFASYPSKINMQDEYIEAVLKEMSKYSKTEADTVYIGGGTPTCLNADCLEKLLCGIQNNFNIAKNAEYTIEVNPKTIDSQKADIMKKYGVNRISLGVQSFNDKELEFLGRIHTCDDTISTYNLLRKKGFDNISVDVMYAFEGQSINSLSTTIDKVLNLNPEHISCYGLKIEHGTPFYKMLEENKIHQTDEDTFADMYDMICHKLRENRYVHYEISNFSKKGKESKHNLKYWSCLDYLGFGVSAASCVGQRRYTHSSVFEDYINGGKLCEDYTMSNDEAMREFVILGLRVINSGVNKEEFKRRFSVDFDDIFAEQTKRFESFFLNDDKCIKLKENAALVSNAIMCEFI